MPGLEPAPCLPNLHLLFVGYPLVDTARPPGLNVMQHSENTTLTSGKVRLATSKAMLAGEDAHSEHRARMGSSITPQCLSIFTPVEFCVYPVLRGKPIEIN